MRQVVGNAKWWKQPNRKHMKLIYISPAPQQVSVLSLFFCSSASDEFSLLLNTSQLAKQNDDSTAVHMSEKTLRPLVCRTFYWSWTSGPVRISCPVILSLYPENKNGKMAASISTFSLTKSRSRWVSSWWHTSSATMCEILCMLFISSKWQCILYSDQFKFVPYKLYLKAPYPWNFSYLRQIFGDAPNMQTHLVVHKLW